MIRIEVEDAIKPELKSIYNDIDKISDKYNLTFDVIIGRFHKLHGGYNMCKEDREAKE